MFCRKETSCRRILANWWRYGRGRGKFYFMRQNFHKPEVSAKQSRRGENLPSFPYACLAPNARIRWPEKRQTNDACSAPGDGVKVGGWHARASWLAVTEITPLNYFLILRAQWHNCVLFSYLYSGWFLAHIVILVRYHFNFYILEAVFFTLQSRDRCSYHSSALNFVFTFGNRPLNRLQRFSIDCKHFGHIIGEQMTRVPNIDGCFCWTRKSKTGSNFHTTAL